MSPAAKRGPRTRGRSPPSGPSTTPGIRADHARDPARALRTTTRASLPGAAVRAVAARTIRPTGRRRQLEPEPRPLALDALEADRPVVGLDDLARQRQPQPGATDRAFGRDLRPVEALE